MAPKSISAFMDGEMRAKNQVTGKAKEQVCFGLIFSETGKQHAALIHSQTVNNPICWNKGNFDIVLYMTHGTIVYSSVCVGTGMRPLLHYLKVVFAEFIMS